MFLLVCAVLVPRTFAQVEQLNWKLPPVDNSTSDTSLVAFLTTLGAVVENRDAAGLQALLLPGIKAGLGDDEGADKFVSMWGLETAPATSQVWDVLSKILRLGGNWYGSDEYCVPHLEGAFPNELDPFQYAVVVGDSVRLRRNPSAASATEASLSWDIVQILAVNGDWHQVRTHLGKIGFVSSDYIHTPAGYRACFRKDDAGAWKIRMLLAGD